MMTESEMFVWEIAGTSTAEHLGNRLRMRLRSALRRAHAPLKWAVLFLSLVAYSVPLLLFEQPLREALAAQATERAWLAIAILLGISTLVISPVFGLMAHVRRESNTLIEAGRRFRSTLLPNGDGQAVRLSIATHGGDFEVVVPHLDRFGSVGQEWTVYAIPEEASLAAVLVPSGAREEVVVGYLEPAKKGSLSLS